MSTEQNRHGAGPVVNGASAAPGRIIESVGLREEDYAEFFDIADAGRQRGYHVLLVNDVSAKGDAEVFLVTMSALREMKGS